MAGGRRGVPGGVGGAGGEAGAATRKGAAVSVSGSGRGPGEGGGVSVRVPSTVARRVLFEGDAAFEGGCVPFEVGRFTSSLPASRNRHRRSLSTEASGVRVAGEGAWGLRGKEERGAPAASDGWGLRPLPRRRCACGDWMGGDFVPCPWKRGVVGGAEASHGERHDGARWPKRENALEWASAHRGGPRDRERWQGVVSPVLPRSAELHSAELRRWIDSAAPPRNAGKQGMPCRAADHAP